MTTSTTSDTRSEEYKWAWEIHKNCDQLLHQRLASFTAAQAMTLAAFTLLTVARFNAAANIPVTRLVLLDCSRLFIVAFGLILALFAWFVTLPMLRRLLFLNEYILKRDDLYRRYIDFIDNPFSLFDREVSIAPDGSPVLPGLKPWDLRFPLTFYRNIIPMWLPLTEVTVWILLFVFTLIGTLVLYAP